MSGKALILRADALRLPLPDESVDLIVCSPPYFSLRSYRDGGEHYANQLGSEPTPQEFLESLWAVMAECWRVLKPTGSCFVNLGDKRSGSGGHNNANLSAKSRASSTLAGKQYSHIAGERLEVTPSATRRNAPDRYNQAAFGRPKSKMLLPHRFAEGCMDGLASPCGCPEKGGYRCPPGMHRLSGTCVLHGRCRTAWIMRSDIVWQKLNGLPESVTDRCRDSHEYVFHLTKSERYFAAVDEVREPHAEHTLRYYGPGTDATQRPKQGPNNAQNGGRHLLTTVGSLGKLPGSVWPLASEPLIDEDQEVTWIGKIGLCHACGLVRIAGNGLDSSTRTGTGWSTSPIPAVEGEGVADSSTVSPMSSTSALSLTGSPSTTCVETGAASTLTISKPSPSASTSSVAPTEPLGTQPRPSAPRATPMTTPTPSGITAAEIVERVGTCVCASLVPLPNGSVWPLPSEPLIVSDEVKAHYDLCDHFASFPTELVRRVILGWSPSGVCTGCGEGRRPVVAKTYGKPAPTKLDSKNRRPTVAVNGGPPSAGDVEATITGYACRCTPYTDHPERRGKDWNRGLDRGNGNRVPVKEENTRGPVREYDIDGWTPAPTRPAVVLDIFGGTGTTAGVARALGRTGVSVDLSHDYSRLADYLIHRSSRFAKVNQRTHKENQGDLFGASA